MRRDRWWHLVADDEEGLGLVEVLIAMFILSVALLAMASVGTSSLVSLRLTRDREQATNAASAAIEDARANSFDGLALAAGSDPTTLPSRVRDLLNVNSSTCVDDEPLVTDAASTRPIPLTRTSGTNGAHTVHTIVTWADQGCGATGSELKRVVSLVTWQDGDRFNSVRNETLVAPAGRGLPNPNFDVKPSSGAIALTPSQVSDGASNGTMRCVEHQMRNLGAGDSYGYEVVSASVAGTTTPVSPAGVGGFSLPTAGWEVFAYLEPASTETRGGEAPASTADRFVPASGSPRPVAPLRLESAEQGLLSLCWRPTTTSASSEVEVVINVHSRFDDRRVETLTHTLNIGEAVRRLYLQDWNDLAAHPRGEPGNNANQLRYRAQVMNPRSSAAAADRSQLPAPEMFDWSTEIGNVSLPGIRIPRLSQNNPRLDQIEYRYQLPAPARLLPGATLHLWSAPRNALPDTTPGGPTQVSWQVELDVLTASDGNNNRFWPTAGPLVYTHTYDHTQPKFQRRSIPLNFTDSPQLQANHRIRVRLTCLPASVHDCNVALDTAQFDSHLEVRLQ